KLVKSNLNSTLILRSGTTNVSETILYNDEKKLGININPPNIPLLITDASNIALRLEKNWINNIDENSTDSSDPN
mgnify:CR=1